MSETTYLFAQIEVLSCSVISHFMLVIYLLINSPFKS